MSIFTISQQAYIYHIALYQCFIKLDNFFVSCYFNTQQTFVY